MLHNKIQPSYIYEPACPKGSKKAGDRKKTRKNHVIEWSLQRTMVIHYFFVAFVEPPTYPKLYDDILHTAAAIQGLCE